MHLVDGQGSQLPSIEGLLLRRWPEYVIALPALLTHPQRDPQPLESRNVSVPRGRVAFYERL